MDEWIVTATVYHFALICTWTIYVLICVYIDIKRRRHSTRSNENTKTRLRTERQLERQLEPWNGTKPRRQTTEKWFDLEYNPATRCQAKNITLTNRIQGPSQRRQRLMRRSKEKIHFDSPVVRCSGVATLAWFQTSVVLSDIRVTLILGQCQWLSNRELEGYSLENMNNNRNTAAKCFSILVLKIQIQWNK